ncbi:MAG: hypothetical protein M2R45_02759 [Verrucomicrobia subdivision 3 bacterium]|nr:hypothetical protein [Limisphaerales bacterium]MCS1414308.1 hypothetical protein [Limisphaerales bacterium]
MNGFWRLGTYKAIGATRPLIFMQILMEGLVSAVQCLLVGLTASFEKRKNREQTRTTERQPEQNPASKPRCAWLKTLVISSTPPLLET